MHSTHQEIFSLFKNKYEELSGEVYFASKAYEAVEHVTEILTKSKIKTTVVSSAMTLRPPGLKKRLAEKCSPIVLKPGLGKFGDQINAADAGINQAEFGIAETGAIVEVTADDSERLISSLPRVHIAFLKQSSIVRTLDEAAPKLREIYKIHQANCNITLISGPSRTADIEMKLFLGVHGPQESHVIVCDWGA
ncbi:MAG: lactate utilization protein C [bacterium]